MNYQGEIAGLATALCWTITAMSFQYASRRIGSISVNLIRLVLAMLFYMAYGQLFLGQWFPFDASAKAWFYLTLSGVIGFVFGDFFLFKSYEFISSKISMLMMTLAPPVAAILGWIMMGERFTWLNTIGMLLVIAGVSVVVLKKNRDSGEKKLHYSLKGILFALGGAVGQGAGAVFSKIGMGNNNPFASSQIRVVAGIVGFVVLMTIMRRWKILGEGLKDKKSMKALTLGSFFGPFLGVSLSLLAFKFTSVGIASTLMATVPVFILLPSYLVFKEKINANEVIGALLSVAGIAIFFLH